jgi:hypothetical protein
MESGLLIKRCDSFFMIVYDVQFLAVAQRTVFVFVYDLAMACKLVQVDH